jgi:hypothetical protein
VSIEGLKADYPEIAWHRYGAWAASQLDRFREICSHPEPVVT